MGKDPDPIPAGSTGIITSVTDGPLGQVWVRWDNGRSLALIPGVDRFEVTDPAPEPAADDGPTPVVVPKEVYLGILAVRASGLTNMLDRPMVTRLARKLGFREAADWLADPGNHRAYAEGIFKGFKPESE
jgi:hypothetical protein